jgi:hypothetical protein
MCMCVVCGYVCVCVCVFCSASSYVHRGSQSKV